MAGIRPIIDSNLKAARNVAVHNFGLDKPFAAHTHAELKRAQRSGKQKHKLAEHDSTLVAHSTCDTSISIDVTTQDPSKDGCNLSFEGISSIGSVCDAETQTIDEGCGEDHDSLHALWAGSLGIDKDKGEGCGGTPSLGDEGDCCGDTSSLIIDAQPSTGISEVVHDTAKTDDSGDDQPDGAGTPITAGLKGIPPPYPKGETHQHDWADLQDDNDGGTPKCAGLKGRPPPYPKGDSSRGTLSKKRAAVRAAAQGAFSLWRDTALPALVAAGCTIPVACATLVDSIHTGLEVIERMDDPHLEMLHDMTQQLLDAGAACIKQGKGKSKGKR